MTSLVAMMVSGVRSVSPDGFEGIHFFKPLTLIVGENGAGKTTIIECLKYACTGEFPPASNKGASFVHDPKLKNSGEVVAQVRVKFKSATGQNYWATRTAKIKMLGKGKRSFASMESKLEMSTPENKRVSVATTSGTLTNGISDLLGVSSAVLQYVIFCHQEEANWPLGEPKDLKARFDDIFSVSRYTKAMDEVKKARKRFMAEIKVLEEQLKVQSMRKAQRVALMEEIQTKEKQRESLSGEVEKADYAINKLTAEKRHLSDTLKQLRRTFEELKRMKSVTAQIKKTISQFGPITQNEFFDLDDEELLRRQNDHSSQSNDDFRLKQQMEEQIEDFQRQVQDIEDRRLVLTRNSASISDWQRKLPTQVSKRKRLAQSFIKQYATLFKDTQFAMAASLSGDVDTPLIASLLELADAYSAKLKAKMESVAEESETALNAKTRVIEQTAVRLVELQGSASVLAKQKAKLGEEIANSEAELAKLQKTAAGQVKSKKDQKARYEEKLHRLRTLEADVTQIPQLQELVSRSETQVSVLEHHTESVRVWNAFKISVHDLDQEVTQLESRLSDTRTRIKPQIPLLNEGLGIMADLEPKGGDSLTKWLKGSKSSGTLKLEHLMDLDTLKSVFDGVEARLSSAKAAFDALEEAQFNLNAKISSLSLSISKIDGDISRSRKDLKLKQEMFNSKIKRLKGIDEGVVDEIKAFFKRDPCNTSTVEDDDILVVGDDDGPKQPRSPRIPTESVYFHSLVSAANDSLNRIDSQIAVFKTAQNTYDSLVEASKRGAHCALCLRTFRDVESEDIMLKNVEKLSAMLPAQLADAQAQRDACEASLKASDDILPLWNEICNLYAQIPVQEQQLSSLKSENLVLTRQASQSRASHDAASKLHQKRTALRNSLGEMLKNVTSTQEWAKSLAKIKLERGQIEEPKISPPSLSTELKSTCDPKILKFVDYGTLSSLTLADLSDLASRLYTITKNQKSELAKSKSSLMSLESEKRECETFVQRYQSEFTEQTKIEAQIATIEEKLEVSKQELSSAHTSAQVTASEVSMVTNELEELKQAKSQMVEEYKARDAVFKNQNAKYLEDLATLTAVHTQVTDLETHLAEANATEYDSEMELLREALDEKRKKLSELEVQLALLSNRDDTSRKRALQDVLQYRQAVKQQAEVEAKMEEQRALTNGQTMEQLEAKLEEVEKSIEKEKHHRSSHLGMMDSIAKDVANKKRDLSRQKTGGRPVTDVMDVDDDNDVDTEWKKAYIQLETTKLASDDLAITLDALDNALMKYHSTKMSDINQSLKELWENTYRGNDIDYVKIVAENEDSTVTSPTTRAQKNFNYRVVMVKRGIELDMRGRCSAGQKVLASLMIRMALAETFCLNCGILALDEPTSNLDEANVESLAESLRRVIEYRHTQSNFQFIIITHDEEFVKVIGRNSWTDEYYKVKKNQSQHTVVTKKSLRELK
jgi:DNA repair protein RAD50